jgi:hypothetical protein
MNKFSTKLMVAVATAVVAFSATDVHAVWPFSTQKRQTLSSQEVVASQSGPVTSFSDRIGGAFVKTVNPCHAPGCTNLKRIAYCAERSGLALSLYLNDDEKLFYTDPQRNNDFEYVVVAQKDYNFAMWSAAYQMYQQALQQYKMILTKQRDINNLLNDINLTNDVQRQQIEEEQVKIALMQKQYLKFLAKNDLFDVQKFMLAQNKLEQTMGAIGEEAGVTLPMPEEPHEGDQRFVTIKQATVRVMDRAIQKAVKEFATMHEYCFETFCYYNCMVKALYTKKDVKDFMNPDREITAADVNEARANFVFKAAQRCMGGDPSASKMRVMCSECNEVFGKNSRPIESCTNVHNNEFKVQPQQGSGMAFGAMF